MLQPSKAGCAISAKALPKRRARVAACLALAVFRSARPRKQPSRKFLTLSVKGLASPKQLQEMKMSRGMPSMTALLGMLALAGYQNRDKLMEMFNNAAGSFSGQGGGQPEVQGDIMVV